MATVIDELITVLTFRGEAEGIDRTRTQLRNLSGQVETVAKAFGILGGAITATAGLSLRASINWESAWTDVLKTVNGTDAELAGLETRLRRMAREEIPLEVGDLAQIAALAGQLGIATENVDDFTEVIAQLGTTTNLTTEQGAQDLARLANITGMAQSDFDRLGSTVVDLGNNFATTESEIVSMTLRLAGAGNLIGLSEANILAIATALTSVGVNAEAGGTAFSRVFAEMQIAAERGGPKLQLLTQLIGEDFATLFRESPDLAIVAFVESLRDMIDSGADVHLVLEELGFDNVRIRDSLLRSAGAGDLLNDTLSRSSAAWEENSALTREASLRFDTAASRIQFAKNQANDLAIVIGDSLATSFIWVLEKLTPFINGLRDFLADHPAVAQAVTILGGILIALSATLFGVAIALRTVAFSLTPLIALWKAYTSGQIANLLVSGLMRAAIIADTAVTWAAVAAKWALNVAMTANPIGLVILAIVALIAIIAAVVYAIWRFRDQIVGGFNAVIEWARENWPLLLAILTGPFGLAVLAIIKYKDQILGLIMGIINKAKEWWNGLLGVFGLGGDATVRVNQVPQFAAGGIMPGERGAPGVAVLHGGEGVLSLRMMQTLDRLASGPSALAPQLPPIAPAFGGAGTTITIDVGGITVHASDGADAEEIGSTVARHLRDQIEDLVADYDSPIAR